MRGRRRQQKASQFTYPGVCTQENELLNAHVAYSDYELPTFGVEDLEVVDGHLQYFGLLQFGRALLLEGGGHEPAQLCQRVVDAVTSLLLDDAAPPLTVRAELARLLTAQRGTGGDGVSGEYKRRDNCKLSITKQRTQNNYLKN